MYKMRLELILPKSQLDVLTYYTIYYNYLVRIEFEPISKGHEPFEKSFYSISTKLLFFTYIYTIILINDIFIFQK